mmetsp:Transcript_28839/g.50335  ORF Transcript_28839/g.50335 Transcript_28839/m.50335 type:complete len:231 (-) Transcript_28839:124-816(-)
MVEPHFWYWGFPILLVTGLLFALSVQGYRKEFYGTSQIILALLGLYWCFSALWVEALLSIWYPAFDYLDPPNMKADKRPGRHIPYCDISPTIRCSTSLMSPYNRIMAWSGLIPAESFLDFANASLGVPFYAGHILCVLMDCCKDTRPRYRRYRYQDEDTCCDAAQFRFFMVIMTGITAVLTFFHACLQFLILKEVSFVHGFSYIVNFALIPSVLKPAKEEEEDNQPKKYN